MPLLSDNAAVGMHMMLWVGLLQGTQIGAAVDGHFERRLISLCDGGSRMQQLDQQTEQSTACRTVEGASGHHNVAGSM